MIKDTETGDSVQHLISSLYKEIFSLEEELEVRDLKISALEEKLAENNNTSKHLVNTVIPIAARTARKKLEGLQCVGLYTLVDAKNPHQGMMKVGSQVEFIFDFLKILEEIGE